MPNPSRFRRTVFAVLFVVIGAIVIWASVFRDAGDAGAAPAQTGAQSNAVPVVVAKAVASKDELAVDVLGTGLAKRSVTVFPAVPGEVEAVLFSAGARVKKDQVLVQLVSRSERLSEQLAAAETVAAKRLLKRYQATRGTGAVSASVIDEAENAVRIAEIRLAQAREALSDRSVRAAFAGVVGIAEIDPGDRVTPETVLTTLDDRDVLSITFDVPERYYGQLRQGQAVSLHTVAFPGKTFQGALEKVDSRINPTTRTLRVRARVDNTGDLLRPGMSFSVRLMLPAGNYMSVPELAVQWSRDGGYVWVIRNGRAERVPVQVVRRVEGAVQVDGELRAGDPVVVEGVQRLRPGRPVQVLKASAGASQG